MSQAPPQEPAVQTPLTADELEAKLAELAAELQVPGVAAGIYLNGEETIAVHGVTSIENPLAVTEETLFQFGSTGKTFTATAIMRLVEQGKIDLNAPVRTYVPELKLKDEETAKNVTVLQLLNHSAGWQGDFFEDTGRGDDALAKYVEKMANLEQVTPLGTQASYNNASLSLAGRVIEKVTGKTYEEAIKELVLDPIGLESISADLGQIMTRRFVVGHVNHEDGRVTISRPWPLARSVTPAGGWSSDVRDQLKWARFHLGDGTGKDGQQVLSKGTLDFMKEPTFSLGGGALGDFVAISWLIKDIEGVRMVGHGGTTNGQLSAFQTVPERDFAVVVLTNSSNGGQLHGKVVEWALERVLGIKKPEDEVLSLTEEDLKPYTGDFKTIGATAHITIVDGKLSVKSEPDVEMLQKYRDQGVVNEEDIQEALNQPPIAIDLLADDKYVIADGRAKGMKGFFVRNDDGEVFGINFGGRLATRI
jgi:CubicO group peptidase (beta-lactamase class C family)